jgi:hypothetical protein
MCSGNHLTPTSGLPPEGTFAQEIKDPPETAGFFLRGAAWNRQQNCAESRNGLAAASGYGEVVIGFPSCAGEDVQITAPAAHGRNVRRQKSPGEAIFLPADFLFLAPVSWTALALRDTRNRASTNATLTTDYGGVLRVRATYRQTAAADSIPRARRAEILFRAET